MTPFHLQPQPGTLTLSPLYLISHPSRVFRQKQDGFREPEVVQYDIGISAETTLYFTITITITGTSHISHRSPKVLDRTKITSPLPNTQTSIKTQDPSRQIPNISYLQPPPTSPTHPV
ncbi:hypothetical protein SBOR_4354 [Sclerotinia borealis F-4128]|uniref:Uncharacterized protein n=1 Tax=Sclerotinia borealis (strain F-4128) TaxID=1432307 RepID=W9CEP5_SCLBF|nr:hypothetical protein SBOR_4354 [Sclerotinia borealis F-4128]